MQTEWHNLITFDRKVEVFAPPLGATEKTRLLCYYKSAIVSETQLISVYYYSMSATSLFSPFCYKRFTPDK